jgi:hypothetical protein
MAESKIETTPFHTKLPNIAAAPVPPVSALEARLATAQAKLDAARARLSTEDREEIEAREQLAKLEAETKSENERRRLLDLERRLDLARERLGEKAAVEAVAIEGFEDTFIVRRDGKAHGIWSESISKAVATGGDRLAVNRQYAVAVVEDWNGVVGGDDPEFTKKLRDFLTTNPGIVTPITDCAGRLAGIFAAERKS